MAKPKNSSRKPSVKVQDLRATKNPKGGTITHRKAGKGQHDVLVTTLK